MSITHLRPEGRNTLLLYATTDGQTLKICRRLYELLKAQQHPVDLLPVTQFTGVLTSYDIIIIAAPVRYGKHLPAVLNFVQSCAATLNERTSVFVSVNLVARKKEKATAEANPYVQKFLQGTSWKPRLTGVFAGCLQYARYSFWDRLMIRLIMLMTKGPLHTPQPLEYTDWAAVQDFAVRIAQLPARRPVPEDRTLPA